MKQSIALALLILLASALSPAVAQMQDQSPEVVPISTLSNDNGNDLQVRTFFIVRDRATGRVVSPNKIESASVQVSDDEGQTAGAVLSDPTTPIKIALLLDESGSMGPYIPSVRAAAKDAIAKAPDQAQFAIFRFSDVSSQDQIEPDLPFTPKADSTTINTFIDSQYNSRNLAPTCLYTIALQAIHYLAANTQPEERRAIILFTDGKDERADGSQCSDRSLDDVTREADPDSTTPTPIYTVGLCSEASCGNITADVLNRMATKTLAIERHGTPDTLTGLFYDVMDDLRAQKLAEATIAPCEEKQVTLLVKLIDEREPIRGILKLADHPCYTPRATVEISEPRPNAAENTYLFQAKIKNESPLDLQGLEAQVIDPNGTLVYTTTLQDPEFQTPAQAQRDAILSISARTMRVPGDYTIDVVGTSTNGVAFLATTPIKGETGQVLGQRAFKHTLSADVQIAIRAVRPDDPLTKVAVTIDIANKNSIDPATLRFLQFEGKFFEESTEIDSFGPTGIDLTKEESSFVVEIPLPDKMRTIAAATDYKMELTLVTPPDSLRGVGPQRYPSNQYSFRLTPLPPKTFWERVRPVVTSPFTLWGLLVIALGCIGVYAYLRYRSQRVIPRPFNPPTIIGVPHSPPIERTPPPSSPRIPPTPATNPRNVPSWADQNVFLPVESPATVFHDATEIALPQAQAQVSIKVLQTVDPSQIRTYTVDVPCVIGRKDADLTITGDPKISRSHVEIGVENGGFVITDCDSVNGTTVADNRLKKGGSAPVMGRTVVRLGPNTVIEVDPR